MLLMKPFYHQIDESTPATAARYEEKSNVAIPLLLLSFVVVVVVVGWMNYTHRDKIHRKKKFAKKKSQKIHTHTHTKLIYENH